MQRHPLWHRDTLVGDMISGTCAAPPCGGTTVETPSPRTPGTVCWCGPAATRSRPLALPCWSSEKRAGRPLLMPPAVCFPPPPATGSAATSDHRQRAVSGSGATSPHGSILTSTEPQLTSTQRHSQAHERTTDQRSQEVLRRGPCPLRRPCRSGRTAPSPGGQAGCLRDGQPRELLWQGRGGQGVAPADLPEGATTRHPGGRARRRTCLFRRGLLPGCRTVGLRQVDGMPHESQRARSSVARRHVEEPHRDRGGCGAKTEGMTGEQGQSPGAS